MSKSFLYCKCGVKRMASYSSVAVIIPSLSPDEKLLALLDDLRKAAFETIVIVNDGSSDQYSSYFETARDSFGCTVLTHAVNQGKGRALKTAFNYLLNQPQVCHAVTVDADGQHRIADIISVARATLEHPDSLIMGCRDFSSNNQNIPARSRFGNRTTSRVLRWICGISLSDTQTGLRGFSPAGMRRFLATKGERFEYEMNMILDAKESEIPLHEVPIETVYIEENRTSHFNPLLDSMRIYAVFSKFILSSILSWIVDIGMFALLFWVWRLFQLRADVGIVAAAYVARAVSAFVNYSVNKHRVFKSNDSGHGTLLRYAVLCVCQITVSAFLTKWLVSLFMFNATPIKIVVDILLFVISFRIQRGWVFRT